MILPPNIIVVQVVRTQRRSNGSVMGIRGIFQHALFDRTKRNIVLLQILKKRLDHHRKQDLCIDTKRQDVQQNNILVVVYSVHS